MADALGVALADSTQRQLTARPTENLAAYDEYLKGEAASQAMGVTDPPEPPAGDGILPARRRARLHLRDRLGAALPRPDRVCTATASRTPRSASRPGSRPSGPAALEPKEPLVYRAFGAYYATVDPDDTRAAAEYQQGVRLAPDNVGLLGALAITECRSAAGTARRRGWPAPRCWTPGHPAYPEPGGCLPRASAVPQGRGRGRSCPRARPDQLPAVEQKVMV